MKLPIALTAVLLLCISCDSGLESEGDEAPFESSYVLRFPAFGDNLEFRGVETEWNLSSGIVVLGPEEEGEPLARLELHLVVNPSDENSAVISNAILSTSNVRTGTSDEIDARLYVGGAGDGEVPECEGDLCALCDIRAISSAQITTADRCYFEMELVGGEGPATIRVSAGFTATDAE